MRENFSAEVNNLFVECCKIIKYLRFKNINRSDSQIIRWVVNLLMESLNNLLSVQLDNAARLRVRVRKVIMVIAQPAGRAL